MVPWTLEFEEEEERDPEPPAPSTATSSTTPTGETKEVKLRRGEHGRHMKHSDVHLILEVGPQGQPLLPTSVIGKFSNQCSCLVKEKVPISYKDWRDVPEDFKEHVWKEMLRRFTYPKNANMPKCREHVMHVVGKALRNFRYMLNTEFLQKGKTPFVKYNMVEHEDREVFAT
jgi:hypothetical protein